MVFRKLCTPWPELYMSSSFLLCSSRVSRSVTTFFWCYISALSWWREVPERLVGPKAEDRNRLSIMVLPLSFLSGLTILLSL